MPLSLCSSSIVRQQASAVFASLLQEADLPQESFAFGLLALGVITLLLLLGFKATSGDDEDWSRFLHRPLPAVLVGWALLWLAGAGVLWAQPIPSEVTRVAQQPADGEIPGEDAAVEADLDADTQDLTPAEIAAGVMTANGCGACHMLDGVEGMIGQIGPSLSEVAAVAPDRIASPGYTGDATTVEEYIAESILQSDVYIVPDYEAVMPANFGQILTDEEVEILVAFLSSLD